MGWEGEVSRQGSGTPGPPEQPPCGAGAPGCAGRELLSWHQRGGFALLGAGGGENDLGWGCALGEDAWCARPHIFHGCFWAELVVKHHNWVFKTPKPSVFVLVKPWIHSTSRGMAEEAARSY